MAMPQTNADGSVLRLCEYERINTHGVLTPPQRDEIAGAAQAWRDAHRLPRLPLAFEGARGEALVAKQYVGVVEAGGATIEVYPKLDAAFLNKPGALLSNLLWMMEASSGGEETGALEADTATLAHDDATFWDVFALLLARNLRRELTNGVARRYEAHEGDLHTVRGRIQIGAQVARNFNRFDKIACAWDEFTPDIALNRVFRCACRFLYARARGREARRLLDDCLHLLGDVTDLSVPAALAAARRITVWDRTTERFRVSFALAVRLLAGVGHALQTGDATGAETFVFLVDMNDLFERYVHAVLETKFGVAVQTQKRVGHLFRGLNNHVGAIRQLADFYWTDRTERVWIADAKYKHLAKGQNVALTFAKIAATLDADDDSANRMPSGIAAGRVLSPDDVRQLTVYAELDRQNRDPPPPPARLMLVYPFVGDKSGLRADAVTAWNGSRLILAPVKVTPPVYSLAENFPDHLDL